MILSELVDYINSITDKIEELEENCNKKIKELNDEIAILESSEKSNKYISDKKNSIQIKINETEASFDEKLKNLRTEIDKFINTQQEKIQKSISDAIKAKLGKTI